MKKRLSIFLDRDGIINQHVPNDYVKSIDEFQFRSDYLNEIKFLTESSNYIVVVTNQQGVGKKLMTLKALQEIHEFMIQKTKSEGGKIDAVYYCPHLKEQNCDCRKPKTGMIDQAFLDFPALCNDVVLLIGDSPSDIEAARNAGLISVGLVRNGNEQDFIESKPNFLIKSLAQIKTDILPIVLDNYEPPKIDL